MDFRRALALGAIVFLIIPFLPLSSVATDRPVTLSKTRTVTTMEPIGSATRTITTVLTKIVTLQAGCYPEFIASDSPVRNRISMVTVYGWVCNPSGYGITAVNITLQMSSSQATEYFSYRFLYLGPNCNDSFVVTYRPKATFILGDTSIRVAKLDYFGWPAVYTATTVTVLLSQSFTTLTKAYTTEVATNEGTTFYRNLMQYTTEVVGWPAGVILLAPGLSLVLAGGLLELRSRMTRRQKREDDETKVASPEPEDKTKLFEEEDTEIYDEK